MYHWLTVSPVIEAHLNWIWYTIIMIGCNSIFRKLFWNIDYSVSNVDSNLTVLNIYYLSEYTSLDKLYVFYFTGSMCSFNLHV